MVGMMRRRGSVAESIPPTDTPVDAVVNDHQTGCLINNSVLVRAGEETYFRIIIQSVYTGTAVEVIYFGGNGNLNIGMASSKVVCRKSNESPILETGTVAIGDIVEISIIDTTLEFIVNGVSAGSVNVGEDHIAYDNYCGLFRKYGYMNGFEEPPFLLKHGICEMSHKTSGAYTFHLLPYLGADGLPYLYDTESGTKYYNTVGPPFDYMLNGVVHHTLAETIIPQQDAMVQQAKSSLPSRYTSLNYITSVTTGRIDVGLLSSTEYLVRFKLYMPRVTGNAVVGDTTANDSNDYRFFNHGNGAYFDIKSMRIYQQSILPPGNAYDIMVGDYYVYRADTSSTLLESIKTVNRKTPWIGVNNIRILRDNYNRDTKIYYFVMTDRVTNEPIRVMIPCYDTVGQEYGMYDAVTETFYGAEQGSFIGE